MGTPISSAASALVMFLILRSGKGLSGSAAVYHRIMFGLSVADIVVNNDEHHVSSLSSSSFRIFKQNKNGIDFTAIPTTENTTAILLKAQR